MRRPKLAGERGRRRREHFRQFMKLAEEKKGGGREKRGGLPRDLKNKDWSEKEENYNISFLQLSKRCT